MIDVSALRMLLLTVTSWLDRQEREILAYLIEENRVLRWQLMASSRRRPEPSSIRFAGLTIPVCPSERKSFTLVCRCRGRQRRLGLGRYPDVS